MFNSEILETAKIRIKSTGTLISDEKRGLIYSAKVQMSRTIIEVDGKTVNLSPGMTASVEIKTGKRRIIDFFLSPLVQYGGEALRER